MSASTPTNSKTFRSDLKRPSFRPFVPLVGVAIAFAVYFAMPETLGHSTRGTAAIAALMACFWITEALPLPVTSLLPLVLFPVLDISEFADVAPPYAHPVLFLVLAGVLLGLSTQRWNLHRRIAYLTILAVGTKARFIILGMMIASSFLSMWVSNTASAVIMVPIALAISDMVKEANGGGPMPKFTTGMLLGVAYAVTSGSMATLIGTPSMPLMRGYLEEAHGVTIGFGQWMLIGVPLSAIVLVVTWLLITVVLLRPEIDEVPGGHELIRTELSSLGPFSVEEKRVTTIFGVAAASWIFLPFVADIPWIAENLSILGRIDDYVIGVIAAVALFVVRASRENGGALLSWKDTVDVPWGVLLLCGGGLVLSSQFTATGLSEFIGESVSRLDTWPVILVLVLSAAIMTLLTELTTSTATAAAFLPIMGAAAVGLEISPVMMTVVATIAIGSSYMLPMAAPSSMVAFATDQISIRSMVRVGVWLNMFSLVIIVILMFTLIPLVLGVTV